MVAKSLETDHKLTRQSLYAVRLGKASGPKSIAALADYIAKLSSIGGVTLSELKAMVPKSEKSGELAIGLISCQELYFTCNHEVARLNRKNLKTCEKIRGPHPYPLANSKQKGNHNSAIAFDLTALPLEITIRAIYPHWKRHVYPWSAAYPAIGSGIW